MTGCVFTGGLGPAKENALRYTRQADIVVAADSGLLLAREFDISPDYVVGDMDSLPDLKLLDEYEASRVFRFPREKDYTDTELGIRLLREKGCGKIVIIGGGGGRMDHFLSLYSLFHRKDPPWAWLTDRDEVIYINSRHELSGRAGREISLFPAGKESVRMSSLGLKWPLDGLVWEIGDAGISNIVTGPAAEIKVLSGGLILMSSWGRDG